MQTFTFPNHQWATDYPETGVRVQLGGNYTFSAGPDAPPARSFKLYFTGFKYYVADGVVDKVTNAAVNNMGALEDFYAAHFLHESFVYPHPVYGDIVCKFNKVLRIPKGIKGGDGMVEDFELELIEQP